MTKKRRAYDQQLIDRGAALAWRVKERVPFCWMCRATSGQRAKEHIFPLWLQRELGAERESWSPTHMDSFGRAISSRGPHPTTALLAGEVCKKCNGGWMNELETRFRTVMFPRPSIIDEAAGATIAHWFVKTAVVLNTAQNYRLMIPRGSRHAVKQGVPRDFRVFLARMPDAEGQLGFAQQAGQVIGVVANEGTVGDAVELISQAYVCSLRVQDLVAAVVYAAPGGWARPAEEMTEVHPWAGEAIAWDSLPEIEAIWAPLTLYGNHPALGGPQVSR